MMVQIILLLILIGRWQSVMLGRYSKTISSFSFIIATIFLIIGLILGNIELSFLFFLVFFFITIWGLTEIMRVSTYNKNFLKTIPILIIYGVLDGYLITAFNFSNYFIWFLVLIIASHTLGLKQQYKLVKHFFALFTGDDNKNMMEDSSQKTLKYWLLSSLLYIISVSGTFWYYSQI